MPELPIIPSQSSRTSLTDELGQQKMLLDAAVTILNYFNQSTLATESTIPITIDGISYEVPSFSYLKNEVQKLNRQYERLLGLGNDPVYVETEDSIIKKVIAVDLNKEPNTIPNLDVIDSFRVQDNWIFDTLQNPLLNVELDLNGKIDTFVDRVESTRFIITFDKENGALTEVGSLAKNEFDSNYKNNNNIQIQEFRTWLNRTRGVESHIDTQIFMLNSKRLKYRGFFTVQRVEDDFENAKYWYVIDQLNYIDTEFNTQKTLSIGDRLIINKVESNTIYEVVEVDTSASSPRINVRRIEGREPIPVGNQTLKIYSTSINSQTISVSIGFDEHNVIFLRGINQSDGIIGVDYSPGVGFYSNELSLASDTLSGVSLGNYYINQVNDLGLALKDLAEKNLPNQFAVTPNPPELNQDLFRVEQLNEHLTKNANLEELENLNRTREDLKKKISQLREAVETTQLNLQTRQNTEAERRKTSSQLDQDVKQLETYSQQLSSTVSDILNINESLDPVNYKFVVKGFWEYPEPVQSTNTRPQEVVQFEVRYKYRSLSGNENNPSAFTIDDNSNAYFSPYVMMMTQARERVFNPETSRWDWVEEDLTNSDAVNSNQLQISISPNESVEIQVRSISEMGWPDNPVKSQWSNALTVTFPDELKRISETQKTIITDATKDDISINLISDLENRGVLEHVSKSINAGDRFFAHPSSDISSGQFDVNNQVLSQEQFNDEALRRIADLEAFINDSQGSLEIVLRTPVDGEILITSGEVLRYSIYADEYADRPNTTPQFSANTRLASASNSRYFINRPYVINNYEIVIRNTSERRPVRLRTFSPGDINQGGNLQQLGPSFSNRDSKILISREGQFIGLRAKGLQSQRELYKKLDVNLTANDFAQHNLAVWGEPINLNENLNATQQQGLIGGQINQGTITEFPSDIIFQQTAENGIIESNKDIYELFQYMNNNGSPPLTTFTLDQNTNLLYSIDGGNDARLEGIAAGSFMSSIHPEMAQTFRNFFDGPTYEMRDDEEIRIPLNIYFKYFHLSLDESLVFVPNSASVQPHQKEISFYLEIENAFKPIEFSVIFDIYPYTPNSRSRTSNRIT